MTPRERIRAAINHQPTDKPPFGWGFGMNRPINEAFREYMGFTSKDAYADYVRTRADIQRVGPRYIGPAHLEITLPDGGYKDHWGVVRKPMSYGADSYMEISHYPLAHMKDASELKNYQFPSADWFDYEGMNEDIAKFDREDEYAILASGGMIFESSWYQRGFEQMFVDMMDDPDFVYELLSRVTDFFIARARRLLEAADGRIDLFFTADDIGQQEGLLVSPRTWEALIKPHHARLNVALKEYGVKIIYHSDGSVIEGLEGLIDMGIDVLEAVQLDAKGMDPVELKRIAGDRLAFHGGISVQSLLPFGKPEEVEVEVRRLVKILGENGGYIAAPAHAIQAGTPPENVAAMLRAVGRL